MTKILFLCPDTPAPTGGIKQIYRQADILNEAGFSAYVVHHQIDRKAQWFENKTKILYNEEIFQKLFSKKPGGFSKIALSLKRKIKHISTYSRVKKLYSIQPNDIIVIPEIWLLYFNKIHRQNRVVMFNQNCYNTVHFLKEDYAHQFLPFKDERLIGQIVVSEDSLRYLSYFCDPRMIFRIFNGINTSIFHYSWPKSRAISFMPRKLKEDVQQVIGILHLRNKMNGWELLPIDNMPEEQVAATLRKSAIFLSFNYQEGFGLPPAEAMACGCVVVGYSGRGGEEYFDKEFNIKVAERDIIDFAEKVEFIINMFENDSANFQSLGIKASRFIHSRYNEENERSSVVNAWNQIIGGANPENKA